MRPERQKRLFPAVYGIMLTAYAVFTLLDAFVIPRGVVAVPPKEESSVTQSNATVSSAASSGGAPSSEPSADESETAPAEPIITEYSYTSESISISVSVFERYDTKIYAADVVLSDASYLRTGLAGGAFGRNITDTTSAISEENNAIFSVNGDFYGFRDSGFVMRNGYLYRDIARRGSNDDLVIYSDGGFEIVDEASSDAASLAEAGAVQIFSFGPGLIRDNMVTVSENSEVEQAMLSNPRTAVGEIEPLHYVFVVSDGRTSESAGLTLYELAQVMLDLNCRTAYNLDGGGSSTMWFMGRVINNPTSGRRIGERKVSDIVYVGE